MSSIASSRIYYIDSENRLSGDHSNFTYNLEIPETENYNRVCVLSMVIPLSYYLVRRDYNFFTLQEDVITVIITVPIGNYSAVSFATTVTALLNTNSPHGYIYTIALNNSYTGVNTGKFNYTVSNNAGVQPVFIFATRICQQMGFMENSTNIFSLNALVSTNVLDFVPTSTLFLHSNIVQDATSTLQELYSNNTVPYSNHIYNCNNVDMYSKLLSTDKANIYNFNLTDEQGANINLNGHSILITLLLYKKDDFTDIFKKYIKYNIMKSDQMLNN
jgi:hypothetical protein